MEEEEKLKQACLCQNDKKVAQAISLQVFNTFIKPNFADIDEDRLQIISDSLFNICMNGISLGRQVHIEDLADWELSEVDVKIKQPN